VSQSSPPPRSTGLDDGISCDNSEFKLLAYSTSRQVLDYSTRGTYLLGRRLCHLQHLGNTLARQIARLPRRCRETSLQASRWILDKGGIGQPRSAEPGPQLKSLLQHFPVLLIRRIFNGHGIVTFADFTAFFGLALALLCTIYSSRRGSWVGDNLAMSSCSKRLGLVLLLQSNQYPEAEVIGY
jgi:hypothetical protein